MEIILADPLIKSCHHEKVLKFEYEFGTYLYQAIPDLGQAITAYSWLHRICEVINCSYCGYCYYCYKANSIIDAIRTSAYLHYCKEYLKFVFNYISKKKGEEIPALNRIMDELTQN